MVNLFLHVLEISIMVSFMILAVLLIRACFKKMSPYFKCILWLLVGVRLLVPVTISSPFGLVPHVELAQIQEAENQVNEQEMQGQQVANNRYSGVQNAGIQSTGIQNSTIQDSGMQNDSMQYMGNVDNIAGNWGNQQVMHDIGQAGASETVTADEETGSLLDEVLQVASVCWIGGTILMLVYMMLGWFGLHKSLRQAIPEMVEFNGKQIKVYRTENQKAPFLLGISSPKIYMPYGMDGKELEYVLAHELMHIHRKDYLLKPLSFMVLSLYWFHPLVWVAYLLLGKDIEMACDEQVLRENASMDRVEYARALLACSSEPRKFYVCPVAFGESDVKMRVKNVLNYKKPGFWVVLVCVILCVIVALCFMTVPEEHADGDAVTVSGELEQDATNKDSSVDENGSSDEPITTPTVEPTTEPTATPEPVATPVPTMVPENYEPGTIEGFTGEQIKQIREELVRRIVYKKDESLNIVFVSLDDTNPEKGTGLGTIFLPDEAGFHSLDVVNRMETVKRDGNEWLAVMIVPNITMGDTTFPAEDRAFEILVEIKRESDGSIVWDSIYKTRNMADGESGAYYEEENYTRMQINLLKADITHDGVADYIETYVYMPPETDRAMEIDELIQSIAFHDSVFVSVYDGTAATESDFGAPILTSSYSRVHAGNGQMNLVYRDGLAYLMSTSLWSGQGTQTYSYEVFELDAKGRIYVKESYGDGFTVYDYTLEQRNGFADKFTDAMKPWLKEGVLIVGADIDKGQFISTEEREYTSWEFYDWFFNGKFPDAGGVSEPTIAPEDDAPGTIAGFTEEQSRQIRDELGERIKYEIDDKTSMTIWLDSEEYEFENLLGSVGMHVNSGMEFKSLDIVNHIAALEMDGQKWLAVRLVPYVEKSDEIFLHEGEAMEIMIPVSIRADGMVELGEYYPKQYYTQLENSMYVHDAYEEENYTRIRLNLMQADVTHDGIPDHIETLMYLPPEMDMTQDIDTLVEWQISVDNVLIQVYDGGTATADSLGTPIFCSGYSTAHVGNGQLSVVHRDGKDYLLESTLWQGQGATDYKFNVLTLDGAGHQYIVDHGEFHWDSRNTEDTLERLNQEIAVFREELSPWIEEGRIVVAADLGLYPGKEYRITTEKVQYEPKEFYDQMLKGVR